MQAKLKAGKPITMVTMGDSLTDVRHWANRQSNWPAFVAAQLKKEFGSEVTIVNPAIGGTELKQNLVLIPRWLATTPQPDLVTICFGHNDWIQWHAWRALPARAARCSSPASVA